MDDKIRGFSEIQTVKGNFFLQAISLLCLSCGLNGKSSMFWLNMRGLGVTRPQSITQALDYRKTTLYCPNYRRGFTVIELILVLAIAAILLTIASLSAVSLITDANLSQMRDQLLQNIEEARARSITSVPYGIQFNSANATSYTLIRFPGGTCSSTTTQNCATDLNTLGDGCPTTEYCVFNQTLSFIVDTGVTPTQMNPSIAFNSGYTSKLSFTGLPNSNYLWFDRKGMPHDNNWSSPTGVTTITISRGAASKSITIDTAGKVTYEK